MPDLSFLTNYFDVPLAIGVVVLFWTAVQLYHFNVSKKLSPLKNYLAYILLIQTSIEAVSLLLFSIRGGEKTALFYVISAVLLSIYVVYSGVLIRRLFKLSKYNVVIRRLLFTGYIALFFTLAVGPVLLDLFHIVEYITTYFYLHIALALLYVYLVFKLRKLFVESVFGIKIAIPIIIIEILVSTFIFYFRFFSIDLIANELDKNLNLKFALVLISFSLIVLASLFVGISFLRSTRYQKGKTNVRGGTVFFIIMMNVAFIGFSILIPFNTKEINNETYERLDLQADLIATAIDKEALGRLIGSKEDLYGMDYYDLKNQLQEFADNSPEARYIYLYGLDADGNVINYVEVAPTKYSDEDLFIPGDVYADASDFLKNLFEEREDGFEGPLKDEYGVWYTEFDPIVLNDGRVFMLGIDMESATWMRAIFAQRADTVVVMLFIYMLVIIAYDVYLVFASLVGKIELSQNKFKNIYEHSSDAILLLKGNRVIDANRSASILFKMPSNKIVGKTLLSLSPESQEGNLPSENEYKKILDRLNEEKEINFQWKFRAANKNIVCEIGLNKFVTAGEKTTLAIIRDITKREMQEKEKQKYIDDLERLNKLMIGREIKMIELKEEVKNLKLSRGIN